MVYKKYTSNLLDTIRVRNGYSVEEFAKILGVSKPGYYLLMQNNKPLKKKYFNRIENLISESEKIFLYRDKPQNQAVYKESVSSADNTLTQTEQINNINHNIADFSDIAIGYYKSLDAFAKKDAVIQQCNMQTFRIITNNLPLYNPAVIALVKSDTETLIVNQASVTPSEKPKEFIVFNNIDSNTRLCFVAKIQRNVLSNKLVMTLSDGSESVFLNTCEIAGEVILKIR